MVGFAILWEFNAVTDLTGGGAQAVMWMMGSSCKYRLPLAERSDCTVKVAQSCPTLCDPTDYTVHGILQARIVEWVAFPFSRGFSQPRDRTQVPALQVDSLPAEPQGMDSWLHRDHNKSTTCRLSSKPYQWMSSHNRAASGGRLYSGNNALRLMRPGSLIFCQHPSNSNKLAYYSYLESRIKFQTFQTLTYSQHSKIWIRNTKQDWKYRKKTAIFVNDWFSTLKIPKALK